MKQKRSPFLATKKMMVFFLAAILLLLATHCFAAENIPPPPEKKTFRIGYVQSEPYWSYEKQLADIKRALKTLNWDTSISFPDELAFSLVDYAPNTHEQLIQDIFARDDLDLLLSVGTTAGQLVASVNPGTKPVVAIAVTNPLAAHIVKDDKTSGVPNITAAFNSSYHSEMFGVFSHLLNFKKLGVLYQNTESGRLFVYLNEAKEVGRDIGFDVIEYNKLLEETVQECLDGVKYLYEQDVDAIFIPTLKCVDLTAVDPSPIYDFLKEKKIPTITAEDRAQVEAFAVLGFFPYDEEQLTMFQAKQIIAILSGETPGNLSVVLPYNYQLLVNIGAAKDVGIEFSMANLKTADNIFLGKLKK